MPRRIAAKNLEPRPFSIPEFSGLPGDFGSILIDPPWRFLNRTGKMAPEHKRLNRYQTLSFEEIADLPVASLAAPCCHLYLWCPNALLPQGLETMRAWRLQYNTNLVWYKIRQDGGPDDRGVGFYFRNVTELLLFGIKGRMRTLASGRSQVNVLMSRKEEHSKKPDAVYELIERCSPGPYCELFSRQRIPGWSQWGNEVDSYDRPKHRGYSPTIHADPDSVPLSRSKARDSRQPHPSLLWE